MPWIYTITRDHLADPADDENSRTRHTRRTLVEHNRRMAYLRQHTQEATPEALEAFEAELAESWFTCQPWQTAGYLTIFAWLSEVL